MQKLYLLTTLALLAMPCSAQAALVAGWDTWNAVAANKATGVTATRGTTVGYNQDTTLNASPDGTFGTLAGANTSIANNQDGFILANGIDGSAEFTITESGGAAIDLEFFHFDARRLRFGSAQNWSVEVLAGGSLTMGVVGSGTLPVQAPPGTLMTDIDVSLSGLADFTLDAGDSVTFRLTVDGGNGASGQHSYLDNVGISGTVTAVPEPSSLALLGLGGVVAMVRRRRR